MNTALSEAGAPLGCVVVLVGTDPEGLHVVDNLLLFLFLLPFPRRDLWQLLVESPFAYRSARARAVARARRFRLASAVTNDWFEAMVVLDRTAPPRVVCVSLRAPPRAEPGCILRDGRRHHGQVGRHDAPGRREASHDDAGAELESRPERHAEEVHYFVARTPASAVFILMNEIIR